jgi:putative NADH-flavin reductase
MCERVFPPEDDLLEARATERAADLAERLLDELSRRKHDWSAIARDAELLARLAAAMARRSDR